MRPVFQSVLTAAFLAMASVAVAGPFEDGLAAYDRHDYATALQDWQPLADQGLAAAQGGLGLMYAKGEGVPKDYAEAVKWFRSAADRGEGRAQQGLGLMYANGQGVSQDYAEAATWFRKAADQGFAPAQVRLGFLYANGQGVSQDYAEAVKWYRKAADQGQPDAQYNLGNMYIDGQGVARDYAQAYVWFNLAASRAKGYELGVRATHNRDLVVEHLTSAQITEGQRLAREWAPVEPSNPQRQFELDKPGPTIDATKPLVLSAPSAAAPAPTTSSAVAHIPLATAKKAQKKAFKPSIDRDDPDQERQRLWSLPR